MKAAYLVTGLSLTVLLISFHWHVANVNAQYAALIGKTIFYTAQAVTIGLSIASWASGGCSYYPSICTLADDIKDLQPVAQVVITDVTVSSYMLKAMDDANVATYNTLYSANIKNERIVGKLEMIREYSNDIVVLLEEVSGIEVTTIDPEQIETDTNALVSNIQSVQLQIEALEKSMAMHRYMVGGFLALEILPKVFYLGVQTHRYYQFKKITRGIDMTNLQRTKIKKLMASGGAVQGKLTGMQKWLVAHPKVAKTMKAAAYGMGFLLNGLVLYFEISTAQETKKSLETVKSDLQGIIDEAELTKATLLEYIVTEEVAAMTLASDWIEIQAGFVNSTEFLDEVKMVDNYHDDDLNAIPEFTTESVSKESILDDQDTYLDFLTTEEENLQGWFNRMSGVKAIIDTMRQTEGMYQLPASLLLTIGGGHDDSMTMEIVYSVIADTYQDVTLWPNTGFTDFIDVTPYRSDIT